MSESENFSLEVEVTDVAMAPIDLDEAVAIAEAAARAEAVAEAEAIATEEAAVEEAVVEEAVVEEAVVEEVAVEDEAVVEEAEKQSETHEKVVSEVAATAEADVEKDESQQEAVEHVVEEAVVEEPKSGFAATGLNKALVSTVEASGYTTPTPIQAKTIPPLLEGRDVLGQAQTGTGKTAAFALPMVQRIRLSDKKKPQVLVLTPTRELAIQVAKSFEKYAAGMRGFRVVPIYGGQDYQVQFRALDRGAHVVVGTPGRVMDHMRRGSLDLSEMKCLVLDEADEMLRMGFAEDVEWVLTQAPEKRQMALFSATMPGPIREIANKHLKNPAQITIKQKTATADTINQRYFVAAPHQKQAALARILEAEPIEAVLIFVKMRSTTEPLAEFLAKNGLKAAALNGDIAQKQRERIVERLRNGNIDVIVATDVAARGLDVQRISHVVNYDLPHDSEAYIHRIGRTGRAGRSGKAILFVHPRERYLLKRLENATRHTIEPMNLPSTRDINKQRVARFHERITEALANDEIETFKSIISQYQKQHEDVSPETIAAALAVIVNGETPLLAKEQLKQASFSKDNRRDSGDKRSKFGKRDFKSDRGPRVADANMETYRIEVGKNHRVLPGNIVGAIANEAGIGNGSIGKIKIFDRHSTVDLPQGLSPDVLTTLGNVSVAGQKLRISKMAGGRSGSYSGSQSGANRSGGNRFQNSDRALNRSSFKKNSGGTSSGGKSNFKANRFKSRRRKGSTEA